MLRMLDLFSGLGGWSAPFRKYGHDVVTLDFDPSFHADHILDIRTVARIQDLERTGPFDIICASPPCETFSTAAMGRHWKGGDRAYIPRTGAARRGLEIAHHTFALVDDYVARVPGSLYIIENPRGLLRKVAPRKPTGTTWYCKWNEYRAKPTDLWTNIPPHNRIGARTHKWPACHNGAEDHEAQSRYYWKRKAEGQIDNGTQGMGDAAARAVIPYTLALVVMLYATKVKAATLDSTRA